MNLFQGLRIVESFDCVEQFRFPKSKKKRIRNKWATRSRNFRASKKAFVMGDTIIMHPVMAELVRRHL